MKLYHKQLHSVAELKREQKRLKRKVKKADSSSPFMGRKDNAKHGSDFSLPDMITSLFGGKGGHKGSLGAIESMLLSFVVTKGVQKGSGLVKRLVVEVGGAYIKWKAVEFAYKRIMRILKERKEKKQKDPSRR